MLSIEQLHSKFHECSGISTDTRSIAPKSLFIALKGPNFNANAYASEALQKGALYAVVDDPSVVKDERYLLVNDGLEALQQLGLYHRRTFDIPVIGITGTNGKTTTKELVHAVLSCDRRTLATSGNLNNHIGVPLTLLRLNKEHSISIIEMGANKIGDIAELTSLAEPTHGCITNIGKAHLEGFGSYEGVIKAKTEMYAFIDHHKGTLFVNADDLVLMAKSEGLKRTTYGNGTNSDFSGKITSNGPFLGISFMGKDAKEYAVQTKLIGAYNFSNTMLAVAIGQYFEVPDAKIAEALSTYSPSNNRSQFTDTGKNQLILDAYNANPTSMVAALENFAVMHSERPRTVILGDMRELGAVSSAEHKAIVALVDRLNLKAIFVGTEFGEAVQQSDHAHYATSSELLSNLEEKPVSGELILIKGSRGIKLETIVPAL
ncbi:MAG: UDP-N-acetylmuramoyl-tripeptide--D-alanyl-D-alanine ligase [Flavobacteriales bacterium]|nr:UDP-N-acetylmuramoyl-tripeptide--D-alanyl-D-alanine ligase [Flavobacteriales bacterium]MBK6943594.1 UDP-N-acetylmuramoyl-tripeptide--D-alanyl-D-alanine ligase [Flavobacteriales bacterium]MBK7240531.1 UDP-N-acetylmuramoyl-tripeptide--D-alanyl-D-alanine ligase [Flavobacteriales bacterium]MBK7297201.1 UDP-N-acetylmuramoyl-tripeptide--D-alanyl-D-alanine ligase [Flavobacteriales bacterium]MBK9535878.1 UDP-N-acetylmuramoyl-tripeptide--D-alanyl-D-alanine ligase [Flavobacteriales bacterium]